MAGYVSVLSLTPPLPSLPIICACIGVHLPIYVCWYRLLEIVWCEEIWSPTPVSKTLDNDIVLEWGNLNICSGSLSPQLTRKALDPSPVHHHDKLSWPRCLLFPNFTVELLDPCLSSQVPFHSLVFLRIYCEVSQGQSESPSETPCFSGVAFISCYISIFITTLSLAPTLIHNILRSFL